MAGSRLKHGEITDVILNVFYKRVYAHLGYGFLEKVYENAMAYELQQRGLAVARQHKIDVYYRGIVMGEYSADLIVADKVIVESKAASQVQPRHEAQLLNYLRATPYEVGLLLNFGPTATGMVRRLGNNSRPRAAMNRSATKQRRINPAYLRHNKLHLWSVAL